MTDNFIEYLIATFLTIYGIRSTIAGIKKENKRYWMSSGYSTGLKKLLKEKYTEFNNLFWGLISTIIGLILIIFK